MRPFYYLLLFALLISASTESAAQNALSFDGTNDYVQTTFAGVTGTSNRTFEAWIYLASSPSANVAIMDYGVNAVGSRNTFLVTGSNQLSFISGGTNANISSSLNAVPIGQWAHVAFVLNSGMGYLYVNGNQVGTGNLSTVNTPSGATNLRIGQRVPGGSIPFPGKIDEVRIWNTARTATELNNFKGAELCNLPSSLMAYYKLNSGTAGGSNTGLTTAIDHVSANHGTLIGFSLSGSSSNWVSGASIAQGTPTTSTLNISACDSYTSPSGSSTHTSSTTFVDTIPNHVGCDSIMTINLSILQSTSSTITLSACDEYIAPSGAVYDSSGSYIDVIPNAAGCDSSITINLTIVHVDTAVSQSGITLTANASNATYQWVDCNNNYAPISGATSQAFTPSANGNYAVIIDQNSCIDTSMCYAVTGVGIQENTKKAEFLLVPNPTDGQLTIVMAEKSNDVAISLFSIAGQELQVIRTQGSKLIRLDLSTYPKGIYLLQMRSGNYTSVEKLILR
jgi:hypothetical protein